jgi:hypothetical protein
MPLFDKRTVERQGLFRGIMNAISGRRLFDTRNFPVIATAGQISV